jgi:hypothetical protein
VPAKRHAGGNVAGRVGNEFDARIQDRCIRGYRHALKTQSVDGGAAIHGRGGRVDRTRQRLRGVVARRLYRQDGAYLAAEGLGLGHLQLWAVEHRHAAQAKLLGIVVTANETLVYLRNQSELHVLNVCVNVGNGKKYRSARCVKTREADVHVVDLVEDGVQSDLHAIQSVQHLAVVGRHASRRVENQKYVGPNPRREGPVTDIDLGVVSVNGERQTGNSTGQRSESKT